MTRFEDNLSPYLTIVEATEPASPSAGQQRLYIDSTTHLLKATNSSGTDRTIEGLANPLTTTGDLIYSSSGTTAARRAIGSTSDALTVVSGVPAWTAPFTDTARVFNSAAINLNNGSYTTLTFDSEDYDIGGLHSTVTNTERFTIATTAKYRFGCGIAFSNLGTGISFVEIVKNSGPTPLAVESRPGVSGSTTNVTVSSEAILTAADYLWVRVFVATASVTSARNSDWSPIFWIERIFGS